MSGPVLSARIDGFKDKINGAFLLRKDDGVLTVCDDKSVRVWLKRDTGQYWPSIHHMMPSICLCLDFNEETGRLFVGMENGTIQEFVIADDYNSIKPGKEFFSHTGGVTALRWCLEWEWVVSVGKDKQIVWECSETGRRLGSFANETHTGGVTALRWCLEWEWVVSAGKDKQIVWECSETGRRLGSFAVDGWCTCLEFDAGAKYAFVGDYGGNVSVLKLQESACEFVTKLSAHTGSIRSLAWDVERSQLYSASNDSLIICWDIGGKKGTAIELTAHKRRVTAVQYWGARKLLFSAGDSGSLVAWDMAATRKETPAWTSSDSCQRCDAPFFWNIRCMWERKVVGLRQVVYLVSQYPQQHHCRLCGMAVCHTCSAGSVKYPKMGYEIDVRACKDCQTRVEGEGQAGGSSSSTNALTPLASFYDVGHSVLGLDLDPLKGRLLSYGTDRVLKIWDVSSILKP